MSSTNIIFYRSTLLWNHLIRLQSFFKTFTNVILNILLFFFFILSTWIKLFFLIWALIAFLYTWFTSHPFIISFKQIFSLFESYFYLYFHLSIFNFFFLIISHLSILTTSFFLPSTYEHIAFEHPNIQYYKT